MTGKYRFRFSQLMGSGVGKPLAVMPLNAAYALGAARSVGSNVAAGMNRALRVADPTGKPNQIYFAIL